MRPFLALSLGLASLALVSSARADDAGVPDALPPAVHTPSANGSECPSDPRCERATFSVSKSEKVGADFDFDTGWLPKDAAVQVRLVAFLHGRTRVDMGGTLDATWPEAIRLRPEGRKATGLLAIDDGVVVKAQGKFKVTVAGKEYAWTGDLPGVPGIDLHSVSSTIFDPWAWKGGPIPSTSGRTKQIELAKVPLTDSIIPIPGISGGFQLEGEGEFGASYASLRIAFDEVVAKGVIADVTPTSALTRVLFSSAPGLDATLNIHGELVRETKLHFIPGFYFEILGKKFDLELVDIPVALPKSENAWDFDDVKVHFPLPRIEVRPNPVNLGDVPLGKPTPVLLTVFDTGEARLVIDASDASGTLDVTSKHVDVPGGSSDAVHATLTPKVVGPIETTLLLASNDPAVPKLAVKVKANVVDGAPAAAPDAPGTEAAGGCGCRVAHESSRSRIALGALGALCALIALARRIGRPRR